MTKIGDKLCAKLPDFIHIVIIISKVTALESKDKEQEICDGELWEEHHYGLQYDCDSSNPSRSVHGGQQMWSKEGPIRTKEQHGDTSRPEDVQGKWNQDHECILNIFNLH